MVEIVLSSYTILSTILLSLVFFILKKIYELQKIFNHEITDIREELLEMKNEMITEIYKVRNDLLERIISKDTT